METGAGKLYRYRDIWAATSQFANALKASGVKPGDRVAAQVEKSPEALFLFLACLRAGAAYLPLNTAYTEAEVEYFLRDAEPSVFVCRPGMSEAASLCERSGAQALFTLGRKTMALSRGLLAGSAMSSKMCRDRPAIWRRSSIRPARRGAPRGRC